MNISQQRFWLSLVLFLLVADLRADWPQFRGPTGMGISSAKNVPVTWSQQENLAWKVKLLGAGVSSPIIVGDRIFLTAFSGYAVGQPESAQQNLRLHLLCLNAADGSIRWDKTIDPKLPEQARMRENHGYASPTPAADGDNVYAFFGRSGVVAFTHDGKQLWHKEVGVPRGENFGCGASVMLAGNLVIVNASVESGTLFAFDKRAGKEVWKQTGIRESFNTPILVGPVGKQELVLASQGKVHSFDPATGAPRWNCRTDIGWYMVPSLVAENGIVGCVGGRSGIAALAVRTGGKGEVTASHRLWTGKAGSNVTSPILVGGHMYWMNDNIGVAYCADVKTGALRYQERIPTAQNVYASPVLAEGRIYYVGRDGRTFVVAAKPSFELIATNDLRDQSEFNASPAVGDGRLLIRSQHYLYCVGK